MDLHSITVLVLTYNEEANLQRCLERLRAFSKVLIVDSFSVDATEQIAKEFTNVQIIKRKFDHFADQCNFGLDNIESNWTLSIDADYMVPEKLLDEIQSLNVNHAAYSVDFRYCIYGRPLRGALYPERTVLYQTRLARYQRDGHAHRVLISGPQGKINSKIDHDDRKSLSVWCSAQRRYAIAEADKLEREGSKTGWKDRIRSWTVVAPVLVAFYCLFVKLLVLDGAYGFIYTYQRVFAEISLALELLDRRCKRATANKDSQVIS